MRKGDRKGERERERERERETQLAHKVGPKWGRSGFYMGMWGPYLSHIAHMGPIWYLRGVMWVCGAHVFPT